MVLVVVVMVSVPGCLATLPHGSFDGHMTLSEVNSFFTSLSTTYPDWVQRSSSIGNSVEHRPIMATCVGACSNAHAPAILITAMHHSREPMSMTVAAYFVDKLLSEAKDGNEEYTTLLHTRQLWFVPVVNPDGYEYNHKKHPSGGGMARKNRRPGCGSGVNRGVDLNRNYDFAWDVDDQGSNPSKCAEDYRGTAPFSEPETAAIRDLTAQHHFSVALNFHSYGRFINVPYATNKRGMPDSQHVQVFNKLATDMAAVNHYRFGQAWAEATLYTVNGEASDWMFATRGIYAMSPEVGPAYERNDGFWPKPREVDSLGLECFQLQVTAAWAAGSHVVAHVTSVTVGDSDPTQPACRSYLVGLRLDNRGVQAATSVTVALAATIEGMETTRRRLRGSVLRGLSADANVPDVVSLPSGLQPYGSSHVQARVPVCDHQQSSVRARPCDEHTHITR